MADVSLKDLQPKMLEQRELVLASPNKIALEAWLTQYAGADTEEKKNKILGDLTVILEKHKNPPQSYDFYENFYNFLSRHSLDPVAKSRLAITAELVQPDQQKREAALKRELARGQEHREFAETTSLMLIRLGVPIAPIDVYTSFYENPKNGLLETERQFYDKVRNALASLGTGSGTTKATTDAQQDADIFGRKFGGASGEPKKEEGKNDIAGWIAAALAGILGWVGGGIFGNMFGGGGMFFSIALAIAGFFMAKNSGLGDKVMGWFGGGSEGDGKGENGKGQQLARGQGATAQGQGTDRYTSVEFNKRVQEAAAKGIKSQEVIFVPNVENDKIVSFTPTIVDNPNLAGARLPMGVVAEKLNSCGKGFVHISSDDSAPGSVRLDCSLPKVAAAPAQTLTR